MVKVVRLKHLFSYYFDDFIISDTLMILLYCRHYVYLFKGGLRLLKFLLFFLRFETDA